jgi:hypothetical protein
MTSRSGDSLVDSGRRGDVETVRQSGQGPAAHERAGRKPDDAPDLTIEQILTWADEYYTAHNAWPDIHQMTGLGPIEGAPGETWKAINFALAMGKRGLPGDSSLAELLAEHRGAPKLELGPDALAKKLWSWEQEHFPVRKPKIRLGPRRSRPLLTIREIVVWADAHLTVTGKWPDSRSGPVRDALYAITWGAIQSALSRGLRGLPEGYSLARLRNEHFGIKPRCNLSVEQVLAWADAHHAAMGKWPGMRSGAVRGVACEHWCTIDSYLKHGRRGLPGGQSLSRLLAEQRGVRNAWSRKPLSIDHVLAWADAFHADYGGWPNALSGSVEQAPEETWQAIDSALKIGGRGLPASESLAALLQKHRGPDAHNRPRALSVEQVLAWADAHHAATGRWPKKESGTVAELPAESWGKIERALRKGHRGLPGGLTLARFLEHHRGVRNRAALCDLTPEQILAWADAYRAAHGRWPVAQSGRVEQAPGETWSGISQSLMRGRRGLSGWASLHALLVAHWGAEPRKRAPDLSIDQILVWADAHHASTGCWPTQFSGEIADGLTWCRVSQLLGGGGRGLPGGSSLVRLLAERRGYRNKADVPKLTVEQILAWADAHHVATGNWPNPYSGPVKGAPGETWKAIESALVHGSRSLAGGWTLPRLLAEHRGYRNRGELPHLTPEQILAWADAHRAATGHWPGLKTGPVATAPGETWMGINSALTKGYRGLPGGSSLPRLLAEQRGRRNRKGAPKLTPEGILAWADAHLAATGRWPSKASGPVAAAPGETWLGIHVALSSGIRGLPGGSTLASLLDEARQRPIRKIGGPLTPEQILAWCDHQRTGTGSWPTKRSGAVLAAHDETWGSVDQALRTGGRGLRGGSSLARLLAAHRGVADRRPESLLPTRPPRPRR